MIVTGITELSKTRCKIEIDQEFAFVLYKGELRLYHLREGQEITEEDYRTILEEVLPKRAKLRAMNLLKSREYTTQQLRMKLSQGLYPEVVIDEAIAYVGSFHYIDDRRYAADYINSHADTRSRRRIEQDLLRKGISSGAVEQAWNEWEAYGGEQDEMTMIRQLLEKKHYSPQADAKERQRMYGFLLRRGYSPELICKALGD